MWGKDISLIQALRIFPIMLRRYQVVSLYCVVMIQCTLTELFTNLTTITTMMSLLVEV